MTSSVARVFPCFFPSVWNEFEAHFERAWKQQHIRVISHAHRTHNQQSRATIEPNTFTITAPNAILSAPSAALPAESLAAERPAAAAALAAARQTTRSELAKQEQTRPQAKSTQAECAARPTASTAEQAKPGAETATETAEMEADCAQAALTVPAAAGMNFSSRRRHTRSAGQTVWSRAVAALLLAARPAGWSLALLLAARQAGWPLALSAARSVCQAPSPSPPEQRVPE